ncbi:hypothetical protein [Micromonospora sp. CNB394]|uniref:hypothetical protein n=1 Tax=Micromonospora sp. CNB394 TaxID=1169151 RepID=UPI0003A85E13|nr:hypothetical protein [Micromonospora sp. CNB394]
MGIRSARLALAELRADLAREWTAELARTSRRWRMVRYAASLAVRRAATPPEHPVPQAGRRVGGEQREVSSRTVSWRSSDSRSAAASSARPVSTRQVSGPWPPRTALRTAVATDSVRRNVSSSRVAPAVPPARAAISSARYSAR